MRQQRLTLHERRKARIARRLGLEEAQRPVTINVAPGATYVSAGPPPELPSAMPMAAAVDPVRHILHMQHQQMLLQQQWKQLQEAQAQAGAALAAQQQAEQAQNEELLMQQQAAQAAAAATNTVTDQHQLLLQQQLWLQQQSAHLLPAPMPQTAASSSTSGSDPLALFNTLVPQQHVPGQYLLPEEKQRMSPMKPGDGQDL